MLFFSWNKSKEERKRKKETKTKNKNKAKKKDKKEGTKKRKRERQRKRKWKRGRPKKAREKERETLKNKQEMPCLGGKTGFFYETTKKGKEPTKKKKTKKKQKKKKKKKKKRKQQEKTKNTQKWAFQLSVNIFFFFGWVSKISLFWQLGPKSAHPENTIKIGVSGPFFLESRCASRNGHFWTKKTKIHKFQLSFFFACFLLFQQQKTPKTTETPIFIVF